jgi:drug/metabolite transporter (DMT)-like permease
MAMSEHRLGLTLVAVSTLAWSTAGLFSRAITVDLPTVLIWRGLFAGLGMAVVLVAMQGVSGLAAFARLGRAGWLYAGVSALGIFTYIAALRMTSIAHVAIIYATMPFVTAALAWLVLHQRPGRSSTIASVAAFAGAVVMVGLGHEGSLAGDFLALMMTFSMAAMTVIARRNPTMPALPAGIMSIALSVALCLPLAATALPPAPQLWLLAGFGLINSTLGFSLFVIGSKRIAPIETALLGALEAPITPLWVWLVFAETPSWPTIAGGAVVFVAVVWHIGQQYRAA